MAAPHGVGQPRKECTISRGVRKVLTALCQSCATAMPPHRLGREVRARPGGQFLELVTRILDQPRYAAVIPRAGDHDSVGGLYRLEEWPCGLNGRARVIHRVTKDVQKLDL
jgi:hypothetical protein